LQEKMAMASDLTAGENGLDLPELLERVEYDHGLLRELLDIFREEYPVLRDQLQAAIAGSDLKAIQVAAHTLKGMLASMSFSRASASAVQIETMAAHGTMEGMDCELARLERKSRAAELHLESVCQEVIR
jgi:HPt (histidine-containing phosphotransfer) domain-containing protein